MRAVRTARWGTLRGHHSFLHTVSTERNTVLAPFVLVRYLTRNVVPLDVPHRSSLNFVRMDIRTGKCSIATSVRRHGRARHRPLLVSNETCSLPSE